MWPGDGITQPVSAQPFRRYAFDFSVSALVGTVHLWFFGDTQGNRSCRSIDIQSIVPSSHDASYSYCAASDAAHLNDSFIVAVSVNLLSTVRTKAIIRPPRFFISWHRFSSSWRSLFFFPDRIREIKSVGIMFGSSDLRYQTDSFPACIRSLPAASSWFCICST